MLRAPFAAIFAVSLLSTSASAQTTVIPVAVNADPTPNLEHPAEVVQVRFDSHGSRIPARLFKASGAGSHPTVLVLHGFPGTEMNLDLARSIQRAGWNAMVITYRGLWGAPGQFSFANGVEDTRAALTWLRDPGNVSKYGIDPETLVVLGHSVGGFNTVMVGDDPAIAGFVVISAADLNGMRTYFDTPAEQVSAEAIFADDLSYSNMTWAAMLAESEANITAWDWSANAAEMTGRPVLVISSDDGNEAADTAAADAVLAAGGPSPTRVKFATDHSYNDHRIALQAAVITWLETTF